MGLLCKLWALCPGPPPLGSTLGLADLYHEEGQGHHGSEEGKDRDGLAHLLIVAARHDPCKRIVIGQWCHKTTDTQPF